jgi:hypothetical protein
LNVEFHKRVLFSTSLMNEIIDDMSSCVPLMFRFPGCTRRTTLMVEDQHSVSPRVMRHRQMSLSCCYRTSVHLLCRFSTLSMFPRDACRIRIASSVVSLTVSSTATMANWRPAALFTPAPAKSQVWFDW